MKYITLIFISVSVLLSCKPEPIRKHGEYIIKNISGENAEIIAYRVFDIGKWEVKKFQIAQNSEIVFISNLSIHTPLSDVSDSLYILFNDKHQIIYKRDSMKSNRNIFNKDNYEEGDFNKYAFKYKYYITEEDYKKAVKIK